MIPLISLVLQNIRKNFKSHRSDKESGEKCKDSTKQAEHRRVGRLRSNPNMEQNRHPTEEDGHSCKGAVKEI